MVGTMPRVASKNPKIDYPPGCKELTEDLSKDELVRRLKNLARTFQDMGQDGTAKEYSELALYLASEFFIDHSSKDVKLLVACCIADVFRIFAPEAPYTDNTMLKEIFLFLTEQLRGLQDTEAANFKRYFYLLENLAWVKSFNICIELDDNQEIFCKLFKLLFSIINDKHSSKVENFMLDMMCPLITEGETVSQELLDIILNNIIEPVKGSKPRSYSLAKDLIKRTANALEPYIQAFFNNVLMLGKNAESAVSANMYELIYELNQIAPSVLLSVLPQLEFKLKSNEDEDRRRVVKLLGKMFSDPDSDLASQNRPLWHCYIGRFNDIDLSVRRACVHSAQAFIVNHKDLIPDLTEELRSRSHDPDENVRLDVVQAIMGAAKKEFPNITNDLLDLVKERTLDKKFKIRKEALMGLGHIYRRITQADSTDGDQSDRIEWIRNKILHTYYQPNTDDKLLVERLLNISLVPYNLEPKERMKKLFILYGNVDDNAVKALHEIFKTQHMIRNLVRNILDLYRRGAANNEQLIIARVNQLSRLLPENQKAAEYLKKFLKMMDEDKKILDSLTRLVHYECSCKKAEECVKDILKKMGNPIPQNHVYGTVKVLLERIAPVMIDKVAIQALMEYIEDAVSGIGEISDDVPKCVEKGMKLLQALSQVYPGAFQSEEVYSQLITFLKHDDDTVSDVTLQIFTCTGTNLEERFPNIYSSMLPVVQKLAKVGSGKQAKHAVRCIDALCKNKNKIFLQIFEQLKKNLDLDSPYFLTALVATGHMAQKCPGEFAIPLKSVVSKFLVKELLMQDRENLRGGSTENWYDDHLVTEETKAKVQAIKLIVRWLIGMKNSGNINSATSTLRMLHRLLVTNGDLLGQENICKAEMARLRLQAGCSILKLAQETCYADIVTQEQFWSLAFLIRDPVHQVRSRFSLKLHKALMSLRLPLQYMSILCLAANDTLKERRVQCKQFLATNIQRRRDYIRQHNMEPNKLYSVLPDYALPFAIHLLAHDPRLVTYKDVPALKEVRDCLWFLLEPLITKNEQYSYSFYRKLILNIKQTKDAVNPKDTATNNKLYAVCDLAMGLVMTKTANFVLKDHPAEPVLPAKLFTEPDPTYSNTKSYLPKELEIAPGKKPGPLSTTTMNAADTKEEASEPSPKRRKSDGSESSSSSPTTDKPKQSEQTTSKSKTSEQSTSKSQKTTGRGPVSATSKSKRKVSDSDEEAKDETEDQSGEEEQEEEDEEEEETPKPKKPGRGRPKVDKSKLKATQSSGKRKATIKAAQKVLATKKRKLSGKITDFISRKRVPSKENVAASPSKGTSKAQAKVSKSPVKKVTKTLKDSPKPVSPRKGRHSLSRSPSASPAPRRRASNATPESSPTKTKRTVASPSKAKLAAKNLTRSSKSPKPSSPKPVRKRPATPVTSPSPAKRHRGTSSSPASSIPSPRSKPSPAKAKPTTSLKKPGRPATSATKNAKTKKNLRPGRMVNGTSDGESNTPESSGRSQSQSPAKRRTAALAKAIAEGSFTEGPKDFFN